MKVAKRRRRESKTDYFARKNILKGGKPRVVFRKTNKYIIAQYVVSKEAKDSVTLGVTSKILLKHGWPEASKGSLKSIPASYLTGYFMGKKVLKDKLETPIVDLGMTRTVHKSKVFAFIKGLKDAGLEISSKEEAFPEIKGKVDVEPIKSKIDSM